MANVSWMPAAHRDDDRPTPNATAGSQVQPRALAGPIARTTLKAKQLFESCFETENIEFRELAEAQLSRFSLWYSNIGVFTTLHASLDYRLRTSAEARSAVEGNLDILCEQLIYALTGSSDDIEYIMEADPYNITRIPSSWQQPNDGLLHLRKTKSTITTLHRLSLTIRKSSNRNTLAKLPRLLDYDEDYQIFKRGTWPFDVEGRQEAPACRFDTTAPFGDYIREVLTSRWMRLFPSKDASTEHRMHIEYHDGLSEAQRAYRQVVFDRCVDSITTRRRQLTYFRRHQSKLSTMAELPFFRPGLSQNLVPALELQRTSMNDISLPPTENYLNPGNGLLGVNHPASETAPSLLLSASFRISRVNAPPSTVASSEEDTSQSLGGIFDIPPPPKLDAPDQEKECPYCCLVYPRATFDAPHTRKWRKHLMEDLQPYICVFRNCDQAGKSYHSFKEWQVHLERTHYQDWQLPDDPSAKSGSQDVTTFDDLTAFHHHLNNVYPHLDKSITRSMTHTAGQPTTLPSWCFVCLEAHEGPALLKHIFAHLKQAFLLALPARDDIDEGDAVSSGRSSIQTEAVGRDSNTIEQVIRPTYPDDSSNNSNEDGDFQYALREVDKVSHSRKKSKDDSDRVKPSASYQDNVLLKPFATDISEKAFESRAKGSDLPIPDQEASQQALGTSSRESATTHEEKKPAEKSRVSTRATRFEDEKRRIIKYCFSQKTAEGVGVESYITHIRTLEDEFSPGTPFNPTSETANKRRILIISATQNGRVRIHKAKENQNGTFSIGKTWRMDDLKSLKSWRFYEPCDSQEEQWKVWAGDCGFTMEITKPYYWRAQTEKEKSFWLLAVAKVFRKYTGGKMPEMIGFSPAELSSLPTV